MKLYTLHRNSAGERVRIARGVPLDAFRRARPDYSEQDPGVTG
ncbi:hypothetical protein [Desertibaculum subflavum]